MADAVLTAAAGFRETPDGSLDLRRQCRQMARQRALLAAASSLVPIPGVDLATDLVMMKSLIERINEHFGLSAAQIATLSTPRQAILLGLLAEAGGTLARRMTTPVLLSRILRLAGLRLSAMTLARLVPLAGQLVAAGIGYWTVNNLASRHIDQCEQLLANLRQEGIPHD